MASESILSAIVTSLSKGSFISGQSLADDLGISRGSISNYIKELNNIGLDVFSLKGRGYRLATPIQLLDKKEIYNYLSLQTISIPPISICHLVDSTNDELKRRISDLENGHTILAEGQTQGRGRRGRTWVSPFGASIYLSTLWRFESGYESLGGLSLLIGIAVKRTIEHFGFPHTKLKWPNDVYVKGKKLAGILIEIEGQSGGVTETIIGIGINVNLPNKALNIQQEYIDLQSALEQAVNRNQLVSILLQHLHSLLIEFEKHGLAPFINEWQHADLYADQHVQLAIGNQRINGICAGINHNGALLLKAPEGMQTFYGGEISVRPYASA